MIKRAVIYFSLLLLVSCAGAPPRPADIPRGDLTYLEQYMDWYIPRQMSKYDTPGVSVALVSDEKILWMKAYGYADAEKEIKATTHTVFQVGSISKLFTATAVMQMVERRQLDLDTPIQQYLPEFSVRSRWGDTPKPTLRELLSHHSGLPTYYLKGFFSHQSLSELVLALKDEDLAYQPRNTFNYSNLGADLAGAAMERVSHAEFSQHMRQTLLNPLGMNNSSFLPDDRIKPMLAAGYVKGQATNTVFVRDLPAGGLFSNVEDLSRFMRMILGNGSLDGRSILSRGSVSAMITPQFPDAPFDFGQRFGLGWMLTGIPVRNAGPVVWHNGGTKTFISQMVLLPEKKLGVIVLANADRSAPMVYETAEKILHLALEACEGIQQPPEPPRAPEVTLAGEKLDRYAGDYSLMGTLADIERAGNRLRFHVLGHTLELVPTSEKDFRAEYRLLGLVSVPIPFPPIEFTEVQGRVILIMRDRGVAMTAEKIPAYQIPDAWKRRVGVYHLANPDKDFLVDVHRARISIEDGKLLLHIRISGLEDREIKVVLMPIDDNSLYVFGIGRNVGDVTRVQLHDGHEQLRYLGYYFEREDALASANTTTSH